MTTHAEGARAPREKSIDEMLDRPGYAEFLAELKDKRGEEGEMSERFARESIEVFQRFEKVSEGMRKLYGEQLKEELGVSLDEEATQVLDAHIRKEILENTGSLKRLEGLLTKQKEQAQRVRELESEWNVQIKGGKDKKAFQADLKNLGTMRKKLWGGLGHYIQDKGFIASREDLRKRYSFEGLGDKETRKGMRNMAQARLELLEHRQEILGSMLKDSAVAEAVARLGKAELRRLAGGSFEEMGRAGSMLESMREMAGRFDTSEDFLPDDEELTEEVNARIEEQAKARVREAVERSGEGEKNRFSTLEKSLKAFLSAKTIGSKEGEEARAFVRETIEERLAEPGITPVQRIFLERIAQKLTRNAYNA